MLCLGMHSNVMLRFMGQAFQDPPLCSSTEKSREDSGKAHHYFTAMLTDFYFLGCALFITVSTIFTSINTSLVSLLFWVCTFITVSTILTAYQRLFCIKLSKQLYFTLFLLYIIHMARLRIHFISSKRAPEDFC